MKFTMKQANDGEMIVRELSDKAKRYYYETDPCGVFVKDEKIFVNESGYIQEFDNAKELEEYFEAMIDEYFDE